MNLKEFFLGPQKVDTPQEEDRSSLAYPSAELQVALGAEGTWASPSVTAESALKMIAVYAAVRVLAEGVGSLPFHLYSKTANSSRVRIIDDPRARLLDETPNPEMTAMELWESVMGHMNLWGNAYLYREINPATGLVQALWPLRPDMTYAQRRLEDNKLFYVTHLFNGEQTVLLPDEIIHLKAFGTGDVGISPIGVARQAIGTALAAEEYAGRFFANDARPGGIIEFGKPLTDDQIKDVINKWRASHQGLSRSHLTAILTNGATWKDTGMPLADAQFLETRHFEVREIARLFRVPPFLIADLEGSSQYKSIEEQSINFLQFSLRPWLVRIEQQVKRGVFGSELDRSRGLYPEFKVDGLLRGNTKERYEAHNLALAGGWMSRAEVRELENLPRVDGLEEFDSLKPAAPEPPADEPTEDE